MPSAQPERSSIEDLYDAAKLSPSTTRRGIVAVSTLNQWALDFDGNRDRIIQSIAEAKEAGARYRLGPELEVPGYSCEDHFYEADTLTHSYESLAEILNSGVTDEILCSIGIPVMHENVRYNCDVFVLNGKIIGFRPKKALADDGNYREPRWFTAWSQDRTTEEFKLPPILQSITGQTNVPIGDFVIETADVTLGSEKCEEMFTPRNPGTEMFLDGAELLGNGSGSHWEIRKLRRRIELITGAPSKAGGVYTYANLVGGDGERLLFDGAGLISVNGQLVAQGDQFSMKSVDTTTAVVDFEQVTSMRGASRSLGRQADETTSFPRINLSRDLDIEFKISSDDPSLQTSQPIEPIILSPEEEIARGPALYLWDYLRRSGMNGAFVALSGGKDSGAVVTIVGAMCHWVIKEIEEGNEETLADLRKMVQDDDYTPTNPQELAGRILHTVYMPNDGTSSDETNQFAKDLAAEIGSNHLTVPITMIVSVTSKLVQKALSTTLKFKSEGGTEKEDLALQNLQARIRMVLVYFLAQVVGAKSSEQGKNLLVLTSANVDEAVRGYFTKFDCSAGDLNLIGGLNKGDLKDFLAFAAETFGYPTLFKILAAAPTAELQPLEGQKPQTDEEDMGMTYEELREYSRLRKVERMGPVSMFEQLVQTWGPGTERDLSAAEIAVKVKFFFRQYAINRHKLTSMTPALHAEGYSPDDNRFDLRPFLISVRWTYQFRRIDALVKRY